MTRLLIRNALQKVAYTFLALSLLSALLLYPSTVLHAEESFSVTDMNSTATVGSSTLNVRSGPGKEYEALGRVSPGDTLTVTGETDNSWYRIDFSGKEGYVYGEYITLGGASPEDNIHPNDPNDFTNYEEGSPQTDSILTASPKMLILLAVIIIIVAIMIVTIIMIKKSDEDEYDDEDDIYYEDDDVVYDEDDDEEYDDENEDDDEEYDDEPVRPRKSHASSPASVRHGSGKSAKEPVKPVTKIITEADYALEIDPRIFDDEATVTASVSDAPIEHISKPTDEVILSKIEELEQELERLKKEHQ